MQVLNHEPWKASEPASKSRSRAVSLVNWSSRDLMPSVCLRKQLRSCQGRTVDPSARIRPPRPLYQKAPIAEHSKRDLNLQEPRPLRTPAPARDGEGGTAQIRHAPSDLLLGDGSEPRLANRLQAARLQKTFPPRRFEDTFFWACRGQCCFPADRQGPGSTWGQ